MGAQARDPYQTLGISPGAPDDEVRKAYRRLVQKYHPDHNGGSEEAERRFEEVQDAYAKIRELRQAPPRRASAARPPPPPPPRRRRSGAASAPPPPPPTFEPDIEARAAALERELKEAQLARERAREAARQAAAEAARRAGAEAAADGVDAAHSAPAGASRPGRPSDEELGYIKTDDSFTKILADARDELSERFSDAQGHPVVRRVSDLIDELDELASKLTGDRHKPKTG